MNQQLRGHGLMHGDYVLPDGTVRCYRDGRLVRRGWWYRCWVRLNNKLRRSRSRE